MDFTETCYEPAVKYFSILAYKDVKQYFVRKGKNETERKAEYDKVMNYCKDMIKARFSIKRLYTYSLSCDVGDGGRLYCGKSIQGIQREFRGAFMQHTTDLDMKNAQPTILQYICKLHNIDCDELKYYNANRDRILDESADRDKKKNEYIASMNADETKLTKIKDEKVKKFHEEMVMLQKLITKKEEYQSVVKASMHKTENANGSAINKILCYYENKILQVIINYLHANKYVIVAPFFDGLLIEGNHYNNKELLENLTKEVNNKFENLNMTLTYKEHNKTFEIPENWEHTYQEKSQKLEKKTLKEGQVLKSNDLDCATYLYEKSLKNNLKCCEGKLYYKKDNLWIDNEILIIAELRMLCLTSEIYKLNDKQEIVEYLQNTKSAHNVAECLKNRGLLQNDDEWYTTAKKSSLGKILFENGYYDFKEEKFYHNNDERFNKNIAFFKKINFNMEFTENETIKNIRQILFYNQFGMEIGNYFILKLARALAGDAQKNCLFGIGEGNTGKSLLSSAILSACGGYASTFNGMCLAHTKNDNADEAQKLRWVQNIQHARIILSNEMKSTKLDGNMIKKISNGGLDKIVARQHFGNEKEFNIYFLPIIFANDLNQISPKDDAVVNRTIAFDYQKKYVDEPDPNNPFELKKDPNLLDYIHTLEFKQGFVGMLIKSYMKYKKNGYKETIPENMKKMTADIIGEDKSTLDTFLKDFTISDDENAFTSNKTIENWLTNNKLDVSIARLTRDINKYIVIKNLKNVVNKVKKVENKSQRGWIGISKNENDDVDDE